MQHMQQLPHMIFVTPVLCHANIINDHIADCFQSPIFMRQILSIRDCNNFGHVFMLGNGEYLFFCEVTESQAIFHRDHASHLTTRKFFNQIENRFSKLQMRIERS